MADPFTLDPEDDEKSAQDISALSGIPLRQALIAQKMRRAQMLMGMAPPAQGAQVGRTYVASSPLEHLASAMMKYQGMKGMRDAEADLPSIIAEQQAGALAQYHQQRADRRFDQGLKLGELGVKQGTLAETGRHNQATEGAAKLTYDETARHNLATEGLTKRGQDQDQFAAIPDATGGFLLYNKKDKTYERVAPTGGGNQYPGKPHDMERDVQALGKDLETVGQMRADLATLDKFVAAGNVPGFGPMGGRVPDLVASDEAISARQAAKRVMASYIQMRSGTAASDKEVERLMGALGLGPTATPEAIKKGVKALRDGSAETIGRIEAKYHPSVVDTYQKRGGVSSSAFQSQDTGGSEMDALRKKYGL